MAQNFLDIRDGVERTLSAQISAPAQVRELIKLAGEWSELDRNRVRQEERLAGTLGNRTNANTSQVYRAIQQGDQSVQAALALIAGLKAQVDAGALSQEEAVQYASNTKLVRMLEATIALWDDVIQLAQQTQANTMATRDAISALPGPLDPLPQSG
jgi:hypothetical protein